MKKLLGKRLIKSIGLNKKRVLPDQFQKPCAAPFGKMSHQLQGARSAHEQTCKYSREELPHPLKQRQDELRKVNPFVYLPLWTRLVEAPHICRLLCWRGVARYSRNYNRWVVFSLGSVTTVQNHLVSPGGSLYGRRNILVKLPDQGGIATVGIISFLCH